MQRLNYYTKLIYLNKNYYIPFYIFKKKKVLTKFNDNINKKLKNKFKNFVYKTLSKTIHNNRIYDLYLCFDDFQNLKIFNNERLDRFIITYLFIQWDRYYYNYKDNKFMNLKKFLNYKNNFYGLIKTFKFSMNNYFYIDFFKNLQNGIVYKSFIQINYYWELWNSKNLFFLRSFFKESFNYIKVSKKKINIKEINVLNKVLIKQRKRATNYVYPWFLEYLKYLIKIQFKRYLLFNFKKFSKLDKYKYNINLYFFKIRNKKTLKIFNKVSFIHKFLQKWYYFKNCLIDKKYNYSFYLLKNFYFFIYFFIRFVLKLLYLGSFLLSNYGYKKFLDYFFFIKVFVYFFFYKRFLKNRMRYKKMLWFNKNFKFKNTFVKLKKINIMTKSQWNKYIVKKKKENKDQSKWWNFSRKKYNEYVIKMKALNENRKQLFKKKFLKMIYLKLNKSTKLKYKKSFVFYQFLITFLDKFNEVFIEKKGLLKTSKNLENFDDLKNFFFIKRSRESTSWSILKSKWYFLKKAKKLKLQKLKEDKIRKYLELKKQKDLKKKKDLKDLLNWKKNF